MSTQEDQLSLTALLVATVADVQADPADVGGAIAAGRRRLRRRTRGRALVASAAGIAAVATVTGMAAVSGPAGAVLRPLPPGTPAGSAVATAAAVSPTVVASFAPPRTAAPAVTVAQHFGEGGTLYREPGWTLQVNGGQLHKPSTFFIGSGGDRGAVHAPQGVATYVGQPDGSIVHVPLTGLADVAVADFSQHGERFLVSDGAAPRGTASVAVVDADGVARWAHLLDPGEGYDSLYFALRTPSQPVAVEVVDATGHVTATTTLLHVLAPQPPADPGQEAAMEVVRLTREAPLADGDDAQLCVTEMATLRRACTSTADNAEDGTLAVLTLADGRVAAGGLAPPSETLATLQTAADGQSHPLRLGLLPLDPDAYAWVGDAPAVQPDAGPASPATAPRARVVVGFAAGG